MTLPRLNRVLGLSIAVITMVFNKNYAGVLVSRFILGVFEASVTPGLSLMTGFWYTRAEMPLRQTIWYSSVGWGGMIGALMAAGISKMDDVSVRQFITSFCRRPGNVYTFLL